MIAIAGIHGNFYSNPFYCDFANALNGAGIDFVYAQTCNAFGQIETVNVKTGGREIIGSHNEDFNNTDQDIRAYLDWAEQAGYRHVILAGHSLGANKVVHYLSGNHDARVEHFVLLSPANVSYMVSGTTEREKQIVREYMATGRSEEMSPFVLMGWAPCIARTAAQWLFSGILDNAHTEADGDFSQAERITHTGALLVGTYDNFTLGDPVAFLRNLICTCPQRSRTSSCSSKRPAIPINARSRKPPRPC